MPFSRARRILGALVLTAPLSGCLTAAKEAPTASPLDASELRELTPTEKSLLGKALSKSLKDPDSAKFEWTKIAKPLSPTGTIYYCATVNAKNSFGGYVGAAPFVAVINFEGGKLANAAMEVLAGSNAMERDAVSRRCNLLGLDPFKPS